MADDEVDWDSVHRANFESAAFWDINWISNALGLYESARKLEPDITKIWESYKAKSRGEAMQILPDYYQGPYFMLLAYAAENLLKAAAVARNGIRYKADFRRTRKFPEELQNHNLVVLAKLLELEFTPKEEDMLRRLTRSAIWFGRYPAPLNYKEMSGNQKFEDGREYSLSWFGENDIAALNTFINSLPARLQLNSGYWNPIAT